MIACAQLLLAASLAQAGPTITWSAPSVLTEGVPFLVRIEVTAPKAGCNLSAWLLSPSAFTVDSKSLEPREDMTTIMLPPASRLAMEFDLEPFITGYDGNRQRDFVLGYAKELLEEEGIPIEYWSAAPADLDFMSLDAAKLGQYEAMVITNRGRIQLELWPDLAPQHVRNFLDLCYTRFYEGSIFHRVMPGFMIQGGDPDGTGGGNGPRTVPLEASDRMHLPGVLSMARTDDPDSASCQFFIMHGSAPQLDGKYSAFGKVRTGSEVVDRIATTPLKGERPVEQQVIEKALVVRRHPDDVKAEAARKAEEAAQKEKVEPNEPDEADEPDDVEKDED